jgi:hypothetical protein
MLKPGDTFLLPKPGRTEHLWIILTHPREDGKAVCVNITAWAFDRDETVILAPGDHPFIKKKSIVHYEDARFIPLGWVEQLLQSETTQFVCETHYACTHTLMDRLKQGLLDSKRTPKGIKEYCKSQWGILNPASDDIPF